MAHVFNNHTYSRRIQPAKYRVMGSNVNGYAQSGIFAMHITYPDTEYSDTGINDWQMGINTTDWRQGLTVLVKTPLASSSATIAEAKNVIAVDLKAQAASHGSSAHTYNLGTEEATRFIAAKINSRKIKMQGEKDLTKYLRAKYVRQSLPQKYKIERATILTHNNLSATKILLEIETRNRTGIPTELKNNFHLRAFNAGAAPAIVDGNYHDRNATAFVNLKWVEYNESTGVTSIECEAPNGYLPFTTNNNPAVGTVINNTFELVGEPPKHTIVLTWQRKSPDEPEDYYCGANLGPIVQGMGNTGLYNLVAKPMDGGNMSLPSTRGISRSGITGKIINSSQHSGFNRFSIEGLNSCSLQDMPPPDNYVETPTIEGITSITPLQNNAITSDNKLYIQPLEYATEIFNDVTDTVDGKVSLENGYQLEQTATADVSTYIPQPENELGPNITNVSMTAAGIAHGLKDSSGRPYARPFRINRGVSNTNRVKGLVISNEEQVFDDIPVIDDLGNQYLFRGGSPFGTIIRDYKFTKERKNLETGDTVRKPSIPNAPFEPNLRLQLPSSDDIPGGVFVRSGHDRVQAYSNKTWGTGGLSAPNSSPIGTLESQSTLATEASQYDTHDRMLIFHLNRILHPNHKTVHNDVREYRTTLASSPSGTTRVFSSHRISDHAERGSVLTQANYGVPTGNEIPHHRIRFGRQGHSFVSPTTHRGTPNFMRRQLHRSHGSSYSLMFEAETEYKHHGFGSGRATNTNALFELDTLDMKQSGSTFDTGSFASDGLPLTEIVGKRMIDADASYTARNHNDFVDYLFAPGQKHTNVEGTSEAVAFAVGGIDGSINTPNATKLNLQGGTLSGRRFNTGSEFMINGFMLNQYLKMGGRPEPVSITSISEDGSYFLRGHHEGVIRPRVATELATVPPLLTHDVELMNMAAVPISTSATIPSTSYTKNTTHVDFGLIKYTETGSNGAPDAFLCHWLAEFSHPAYFGTMREQFLTFRYRESGMPRAIKYPAVNGLLLRNYSYNGNGLDDSPAVSKSFERLYIAQWLQNYGYNGLNAGGHANVQGLRGANAVLMGHTTIREQHGTIKLYDALNRNRFSRGEGIGDSINPNAQTGLVSGIDLDNDSHDLNKMYYIVDPLAALDVSRRLPVRAWGMRGCTSAINMLAGDPNELSGDSSNRIIQKSGRFDGGIHDSMSFKPSSFEGDEWDDFVSTGDKGTELSIPVGYIANDFTVDATQFERNAKNNNLPLNPNDDSIGIGNRIGLQKFGMLSNEHMASGNFDQEIYDTRPETLPVAGPVLWLKGDTITGIGNGGVITTWPDSSGNGRDFTQSVNNDRPLLNITSSKFNGHPTVQFVSSDKLHRPFDAALNTKDFTIFFVGQSSVDNDAHQLGYESRSSTPVARSGYNLYADTSGSENRWEFWVGEDTSWSAARTPVGSIVNFGTQEDMITMTCGGGDGVGSAATQVIRHDGEVEDTQTANFYKSTGGFSQVGVLNTSSFPYIGHIAEIIQYDRVLSNAELEQVEAYLARKYNLAISSLVSNHAGRLSQNSLRPVNKGVDPFIDLAQYTGSVAYAEQSQSASALLTQSVPFFQTRLGGNTDYYRLTGNALHTNHHSLRHHNSIARYPACSRGRANEFLGIIYEARVNHIHEISDTRQIQSNAQPRMGLVMQTETEKSTNKEVNYTVVGTRAASLHSDLILGYQFPVLPSFMSHAKFSHINRTIDGIGTGSVFTNAFIQGDGKPTFDLGFSPTPFASLGTDTIGSDLKRSRDTWAIRQASELPAWGGVYILRKSYLTRNEDDNQMTVELDSQYPHAQHPRRKYVDYIVRPVRPLKLTGFATQSQQDGWCLGARSNINVAQNQIAEQPYTRDKRYGIFELDAEKGANAIEPITTTGATETNPMFKIDYPDANEYDVVYHLIPSANLMQHFKSDANRIDDSGVFNPKVSPRYSQTDYTGGNEKLYQSSSKYDSFEVVKGDYSKQSLNYNKVYNDTIMNEYPTATIVISKGSNVHQLDDATSLPTTGKLISMNHFGYIGYTKVGQGLNEILVTNNSLFDLIDGSLFAVSSYVGIEFHIARDNIITIALGDINQALSPEIYGVVPPSFIDNAIMLSKLTNQSWYDFDTTSNKVSKTTLNYRGFLPYDPLDFVPISQSSFTLGDGKSAGKIQNTDGSNIIYYDYEKLSRTKAPDYIIDKNNTKWNVKEIKDFRGDLSMQFNDISKDSLSASGVEIGDVIAASSVGFIGMRTTDAASLILNDASGDNIGISVVSASDFDSKSNDVKKSLNAHPLLKQVNSHSDSYVSRESRGLNTMETIRNISQLDGRQIVNERNGQITYSDKIFSDQGFRIGIQNGVESIKVNKLFDSPNEVIIVGDVIAGNEIVYVKIQDTEKMREIAGEDGKGLVKTLRQEIPGLASVSEARRLAKKLLARSENGAPMIYMEGLINSTSINAGDIVDVNLPTHGVIGKFAVFEAVHNYELLKTNLIIGQYEKGIEGLLTDVKTATVKESGINRSANDANDKNNISISDSLKLISVHRVTVRSVNNTGFIIGARHKNGLGKIGVRGDNKRSYPIGMSKSKRYVVK